MYRIKVSKKDWFNFEKSFTGAQESAGDVVAIQGDVVTTAYFDALAAEVDEMLRYTGNVEMGDVAKQFGLAAEQVSVHVKKHLGTTIKGSLLTSEVFFKI